MKCLTEYMVKRVARAALFALLISVVFPAVAAEGKEYLVGVHRPNNLYVIDTDKLEVSQYCKLPGRMAPGHLMLSPDNEVAYVLGDGGETIRGISLSTCDVVFSASLTQGNIRGRSQASVAVSPDGRELYVGVNRTRRLPDEFQALPPHLLVFRTQDGLGAKPVRSFDVPDRPFYFVMDTGADGTIYAFMRDLLAINPETGEVRVAMKLGSHNEPLETPLLFGSAWTSGHATGDFIMPYVQMRFADENLDPETAEMPVGFINVELDTGRLSRVELGTYTSQILTGARNPRNLNHFIGGFRHLMKFDIKNKKLLKSVPLDHTYQCIVFSPRGDKVYVGCSLSDIVAYDAETLEKLGEVDLPGGGDMALAQMQIFTKP